jgi:putative oxidoreductase
MKKSEGLPVDLALLVIRIALGVVFLFHGLVKFSPQLLGMEGVGIEGFVAYLNDLGVPAPQVMAYVVAGWEVGGGALLLIGLASRIMALGLLGDMIVAVVKSHLHQGFFLPPVSKAIGYEFAMTLGLMALAIVIAGPGQLALDGRIFKGKKKGP